MATKRTGKYRHIYGDPAKIDGQFLEIKNPMTSGEGQYVKANSTFFAISKASGGGPLYLQRHDKPGRFDPQSPVLSVHKGKCWDFDFHPFIENMIATGSEDCRACVTLFPADGLTENVTEPTVTLEGHQKKVTLVEFNPCANNILSTVSFDRTMKVWDISSGTEISSFDGHKQTIYSAEWSPNGSMLATTSKDKKLRTFDPRAADEVQVCASFDGSKTSKVFWVGQHNWIGATGFTRGAKRAMRLWDVRKLGETIYSETIDAAASVLVPTFDDDTGVLYLMGKGEGTVSFGEIINDSKKFYSLGLYRTPEPQKGGAFLPKKALDVWKCEVMRFLKLTKNSLIPVSFIVPRKAGADVFQEDIFPDCYAGKAALEASEWVKGENRDAVRMSIDPAKRVDDDGKGGSRFVKKATYGELEAKVADLEGRVKTLEAQVKELGGEVADSYFKDPPAGDDEKGDE